MKTKMLVATAVLATAIATPALAQTASPRPQTNPSQLDQYNGQMGPARSTNRSYDVYQNGQYVGSDPDPNIRLQLRREFEGVEW